MVMHPAKAISTTHGFSLVELSIVLVILGLLVGGVLSGQSLIRAAELRAVTEEYKKYATAENAFKDKYFGLPGDITNATSFWGHHGGGVCANTSGTAVDNGYEMCDGDGDGKITYNTFGNENSEAFQAWSQLAHAGLIEGNYTGISGPNTVNNQNAAYNYLIGVNAPPSRLSNAGWGLTYIDNTGGGYNPVVYMTNYVNWFSIGSNDGVLMDSPILSPTDAWNIDTKMDDGMPGKGSVQTWPRCTTVPSTSDFSGLYNVGDAGIACPLIFKSGN